MSDGVHRFLQDVPKENFFALANGKSFGNLDGLYDVIKNSDSQIFYDHVTNDKNDFISWIKACIKYDSLAAKLSDIKEREVFLGVLADQIAILKNPSLMKTMEFFEENPDIKVASNDSNISTKAAVPNSIHASNAAPKVPEPATVASGSVANAAPQPLSQPTASVSNPLPQSSASISAKEESYEFEDVLKSVVDDIDKEISN